MAFYKMSDFLRLPIFFMMVYRTVVSPAVKSQAFETGALTVLKMNHTFLSRDLTVFHVHNKNGLDF
jgi:hypothetical protein